MENKQVLEDLIDIARESKQEVTSIVMQYVDVHNTATEVLNLSNSNARIYSLSYIKGLYKK